MNTTKLKCGRKANPKPKQMVTLYQDMYKAAESARFARQVKEQRAISQVEFISELVRKGLESS